MHKTNNININALNYRKHLGLSRRQLSKLTGINEAILLNFEKNINAALKKKNILKLFKVFEPDLILDNFSYFLLNQEKEFKKLEFEKKYVCALTKISFYQFDKFLSGAREISKATFLKLNSLCIVPRSYSTHINKNDFSINLKSLRLSKNLSFKDLESITGITSSNLFKLENKPINIINKSSLKKLIKVFNPNDLLDDYTRFILNQEEEMKKFKSKKLEKELSKILNISMKRTMLIINSKRTPSKSTYLKMKKLLK